MRFSFHKQGQMLDTYMAESFFYTGCSWKGIIKYKTWIISKFIFRCTNKKVCVSPGKFYDAFCQIEIMGVVWIQPKIIEWVAIILLHYFSGHPVYCRYHGKIIILSPSSPHHNQIDLLTFDGNKETRKWERKRRKKKR